MNIQITSVNISYNEEQKINTVQVYFVGNTDDKNIGINGYVPLTAERFIGNESIEKLTELVRQTIIDKLSPAD